MKFLDVKKKLDKEHGDLFQPYTPVYIPTGIFKLDYLCGGGLPEGQLISFWGEKSSSKTTTALRAANSYLTMYQNRIVVFVDLEHTLTEKWIGAYIDAKNRNRFIVVSPDYGDTSVDIIYEIAKADDVGMIIIDSIAMLISLAEAEKSASDDSVAANVKLVNKLYRKLIPLMSRSRRLFNRTITLLVISQPTVKMGVRSFQPLTEMVGGKKTGLLSILEVQFKTGQYIKVGELAVKVTHGFTVVKSKTTAPKSQGDYTMYLRDYKGFKKGDLEDLKDVMTYAKRIGILKKSGTKQVFGSLEFKTLEEVMTTMLSDPKVYEKLKKETMQALLTGGVIEDDTEVSDMSE